VFRPKLPRPTTRFCLLAILFCAVLSISPEQSATAADVISRKSGANRVAGKIESITKNEVVIKPITGDSVTVPSADVQSIEWDDAPASLRIAIGYENAGQSPKALDAYQKIKADGKLPNDFVSADLEYLIARATARIALADPTQVDEAISKLEGVTKSQGDHFRYYEALSFLGQVLLAKNDAEGARRVFDRLANSSQSDFKVQGQIAQARVLMAEAKTDEAIAAYDNVISTVGSGPQEAARKFEALVGKAKGQLTLGKSAEALATIDEIINNASPDDTALFAEAYLLQGNAFEGAGRTKEAMLAYLHVEILFPKETAFQAEALYHLSKLWKAVQLPDRAIEAQAKLESDYPNSPWAKKLAGGE
jgi:tetratricopeptide (TPR) repeat protein